MIKDARPFGHSSIQEEWQMAQNSAGENLRMGVPGLISKMRRAFSEGSDGAAKCFLVNRLGESLIGWSD